MSTLSPVRTTTNSAPVRSRAIYENLQAAIALDPRATTLRLRRQQHLQFRNLDGWTVRAVPVRRAHPAGVLQRLLASWSGTSAMFA